MLATIYNMWVYSFCGIFIHTHKAKDKKILIWVPCVLLLCVEIVISL